MPSSAAHNPSAVALSLASEFLRLIETQRVSLLEAEAALDAARATVSCLDLPSLPKYPNPARGRAARASVVTPSRESLSPASRAILEPVRRVPTGLQSEEFASAIGSQNLRGVPVRMMTLRKELKALGLKPEDVIITEKIYVKGRLRSVFKPGPRIADVLRRAPDLLAGAK